MKRAFSAGSSIIEGDALSRTGRMERLLDLAMKDRLWRKRQLRIHTYRAFNQNDLARHQVVLQAIKLAS
jgi:ATP-dependent 26S proteasome regulatory subunit